MIEPIIEGMRKRMFSSFEKDLDNYKGTQKKIMSFMVRVLPKIVASLTIFFGLLWIFNKLYDRYGLDRIIILLGLLILLTLRRIDRTLKSAV